MVDAQAIDATELLVCVRDRTGRYVLVNEAFAGLTGLPRERLHGKRDSALNPQDIADRIAGNDAQVFDTGAPSEVDEELLGRDGRIPVRSCRFAIVNDEGEPWAVCSVSSGRDEADEVRVERDRLASIADGTPVPHSALTSKRLDALVSDLATARKAAAGLTEALEAERTAREEQAAELERLRVAAAEAEAGRAAAEVAREEADRARADAEAAAQAEADSARRQADEQLAVERERRAQLEAGLEESLRDLERTRHELEAAREELAETRTAPAAVGALSATAEPAAEATGSASLVWVQRRVADLIADAPSFEAAMRSALAAFGELAGWDAVVGWLPARDGALLRPANVWCSQAVAGSTFDVQSWQAVLDDGPSELAAAWDADAAVWIDDASGEDRPRCRWASAAGLTTATAVPVAVDGERHGMIEAYRREPGPRDEDVVAVLETIATQLGGLERRLEAGHRWR